MTTHAGAVGRIRSLIAVPFAAGCLLAGCGLGAPAPLGSHALRLASPLSPGVGSALRVEPNSPWLLGSLPICPSGTTPVVVTAVHPDSGDLKVSAFSIRTNPYLSGKNMLGDARGDLAANGLQATPDATLDEPCDKAKGRFYELILQLESSDTDTSAKGFRVEYTADGASGVLDVPFEAHSCSSFTTPMCASLHPGAATAAGGSQT